MRLTRTRLLWMTATVAAVAGLTVALRPSPVIVEAAAITRGPLQITVDEEGVTRLSRRYVVTAPVAGTVRRIDLRPGDSVSRGAVVALVDPAAATPIDTRTRASAEARVQAADAAVGRAKAEQQRIAVERDRAAEEAARAKRLFESGYASRESFEVATARLRAAEQAVGAAEYARRAAEFGAAEARTILTSNAGRSGPAVAVRAPIDGVILRRQHESEAVIAAGAPLVEIGNLRDLEIVSDLLTTDAVKVRPGTTVRIDRWGGDVDLSGTVERVEPAGFLKISALGVEEQRVNVVIRLDTLPDMPIPLGDGFRVGVHVVVWEQRDVLRIPTSALFRRGGDWAAFVLDEGRLVERALSLGARGGREAEVLAGMAAGETVVLYPGDSLAPGRRAVSK